MKIIIPFNPETFFSPDQRELLRKLKLEDWQVLDQILDNWSVFVGGSTTDLYENTVDAYHDLIEETYRGSDEGIKLQVLLGEFDNELVELMRHAAIQLHYLLDGMPEYAREKTYETGDYHFLKVENINRAGNFAVIATDVRDNMH